MVFGKRLRERRVARELEDAHLPVLVRPEVRRCSSRASSSRRRSSGRRYTRAGMVDRSRSARRATSPSLHVASAPTGTRRSSASAGPSCSGSSGGRSRSTRAADSPGRARSGPALGAHRGSKVDRSRRRVPDGRCHGPSGRRGRALRSFGARPNLRRSWSRSRPRPGSL